MPTQTFSLSFGTGGLRGILGDGPNLMNLYTIGRATQGVAKWMNGRGKAVIAYDTRLMSKEFAEHTANVLAANGIAAYLFPRPVPTPALSFAVRYLQADAGICITASHNSKEYNGYKVYGADGGQITLGDAEAIAGHIKNYTDVTQVNVSDITVIDEMVLSEYLNAVEALRLTDRPCDNLRVIYTPLNGSGYECVTEILRRIGAEYVTVPEQMEADGNFPTCPKPNPEEDSALELGMSLCLERGCDLLLATDPDCDRVGVAVDQFGMMRRLTGNEIGVLLLEYIARSRSRRGYSVAVKTIVTTPMAQAICNDYGIELRDVLTGFKYIGEQIGLLERDGETERYIFGFEESCGYLSGTHVRDKDAVNAAMLICDMAAGYKRQGMTLIDAVEALYKRYGRWTTRMRSIEANPEIVDSLRRNPPQTVAGYPVLNVIDYLNGVNGLAADVLAYTLDAGTIIIRPSGTEPKVKIYYLLRGVDDAEIDTDFQRICSERDITLC